MYYARTPLLDVPDQLVDKILAAVENKDLIPTKMQEYAQNYTLQGYSFKSDLHSEIINYSNYSEFFARVPDEPKLTLVIAKSRQDFPIHSDDRKLSSLTCCIKGSYELAWHVPAEEFNERVIVKPGNPPLYSNVLNLEMYHVVVNKKITKQAGVRLNPSESILFNNNAYHSAHGPNIDMTLIQFGFLNITQHELENIYNEWKLEKEIK
jgi:hypothetical protein